VAAAAALLLPVVLLSGVGGGVTGAGPGVGQSGRSIDEMWHATGWDEVGRRPGDETVSPALADAVRTTGPHDIGAGSKVVASASVPASEVSDWTALRLEVWRASDDPGSGPEIDPDATSPDRVVPLGSVDGSLVATVRLDDRPGARGTWAVVTGAAADGARYVLARDFAWAPFQGSVIDWITAVAR
ncbi:MAG TPA: hypothetical protein VFI28_11655, partial [Candidatus Limnocylindrales bacterium]|nr:hypothetical protein [Candidatus Limnocylindrales bacterium]